MPGRHPAKAWVSCEAVASGRRTAGATHIGGKQGPVNPHGELCVDAGFFWTMSPHGEPRPADASPNCHEGFIELSYAGTKRRVQRRSPAGRQ